LVRASDGRVDPRVKPEDGHDEAVTVMARVSRAMRASGVSSRGSAQKLLAISLSLFG
jgi:hypothetical protein